MAVVETDVWQTIIQVLVADVCFAIAISDILFPHAVPTYGIIETPTLKGLFVATSKRFPEQFMLHRCPSIDRIGFRERAPCTMGTIPPRGSSSLQEFVSLLGNAQFIAGAWPNYPQNREDS